MKCGIKNNISQEFCAGQKYRATVATWTLAAVMFCATPLVSPFNVAAISGGGLDYAGLNLTGQDFSKGKYKSKVTRVLILSQFALVIPIA